MMNQDSSSRFRGIFEGLLGAVRFVLMLWTS